MSDQSCELFILRHAKSDWNTDVPSDFQRPLNKRGIKAIKQTAEWLDNYYDQPIKIISSPALRAWQTAVAVSEHLGIPEQDISFNGKLYLASHNRILGVLSEINKDIKAVMLIGHNPGLEELFDYLVIEGAPEFEDGKILPTATIAHIKLHTNWKDLQKDSGELVKVRRPE